MSYDLRIWSVRPIEPGLLDAPHWEGHRGSLVRRTRNWQVAIAPSARVEPEDIPDNLQAVLPGIAFLTELNLEPVSAPSTGHRLLERTARALATAAHGAIEDRQTGSIVLPGGVRRYVAQPRPERFRLIDLSWFFMGKRFRDPSTIDDLLALFDRYLPEGLPRRYGLYEPPQFRLDETGLDHFKSFLHQNLHDTKVWYTQRPVLGVSLGCPSEVGASPLGFRCNYLSVTLEQSALHQPGWQRALEGFWRAVALLLRPFYAEVRTLRDYVRMGGTYGSDASSERHPISSWWWNGIPSRLGSAILLGPPYRALWSRLEAQAEVVDDLCFASSADWLDPEWLSLRLRGVPEELQQKNQNVRRPEPSQWKAEFRARYPAVWPFEFPFR